MTWQVGKMEFRRSVRQLVREMGTANAGANAVSASQTNSPATASLYISGDGEGVTRDGPDGEGGAEGRPGSKNRPREGPGARTRPGSTARSEEEAD